MHFKANPWEFERAKKNIIDPFRSGLYLFYSYNPYLEVYFSRRAKSYFKGNPIEGELITITYEDVSFDWLQDKYESSGLFGNNESYMILMAEKLDKKIFARILEISNLITDNFLILNFSQNSDFIGVADKRNLGNIVSILEPKFWENEKLFDFVCRMLKFNPSIDVRKFLLESLRPDTDTLISKISMLRRRYPVDSQIIVSELEELFVTKHLDFFNLASLYSRKRKQDFFKILIKSHIDNNELEHLFLFMIRHLTKLFDVEAIIQKSKGGKVNKYNKEIIACNKLWTKEELQRSLRQFSMWHKMTRDKKIEPICIIQSEYLNQLSY